LSAAADVAVIYAPLDGTLTWRPATPEAPGDRLVLSPDRAVIGRPPGPRFRNGAGLGALGLLEGPPAQIEFENVAATPVADSIAVILASAYAAAKADPKHPKRWHPAMSARVVAGKTRPSLKRHLDGQTAPADEIARLATAFVSEAAPPLASIPVRAGEAIGRVAPYLASDPLPASPPFPLGAASDPQRARRLTLVVSGRAGEAIDPRYYLHAFLAQALVAADKRVLDVRTRVLNASGALSHPLVTAAPELGGTARPPARAAVNGSTPIPIGALNEFHGFPLETPASLLAWRYTDSSSFEAKKRSVTGGAVVIPPLTPGSDDTTRVQTMWTRHGTQIAAICNRLQLPCELVVSLIGVESTPQLVERVIRFEPMRPAERTTLRKTDKPLADAYDRAVGLHATVTDATHLIDDAWLIDVTLDSARTWPEVNTLRKRGVALAWGDARPRVLENSVGRGATGYTLIVEGATDPAPAEVFVLEGFSLPPVGSSNPGVPDPWDGTAAVRSGASTLSWDQAVAVAEAGVRMSPGIIQTLIGTAMEIVPWIDAVDPGIWTALGIPHPPAKAGGYLNDWLLHAPHSILVGAAYMRHAYNERGTRLDLPLVGGAYNAGRPKLAAGSRWGLHYHGDYVERAGPHFNAFRDLFDGATPPSPTPPVRLMR
jgi:hypothetical protein